LLMVDPSFKAINWLFLKFSPIYFMKRSGAV
jgi:hypothetical protein